MTEDDHDPMVQRAIDDLRRLPALDPDAVRRVVDAAATARIAAAEDDELLIARPGRAVTAWAVVGVAAAAAFVGFALRGAWTPGQNRPVPTVVGSAPASPSLVKVSTSSEPLTMLKQFVFESAAAHRVSVVGDFDDWDPSKVPMVRTPGGTSWSVIVPLVPGRHIYGFMVDDTVFTLDPRAPKSRDVDLGTEGSVVIAGRP